MIRNWLCGIFIVVWITLGITYSISPYVWFAVFWMVIVAWLIITATGWKMRFDRIGGSWQPIWDFLNKITNKILGGFKI